MSWQLVAEALDHAPPGLTVAERFILVVVGEYAGRDPRLPGRECECSTDDLARRTGLEISGVKAALRRLASRDREGRVLTREALKRAQKPLPWDVRVPLRMGKDNRPVYTYRGQVPRYRLPAFTAPDGCECQLCQGVAIATPSTVDNLSEGVATVTPSNRKGWPSHLKGVATASGRGGHSHPPPVAGSPVAAAARANSAEDDSRAVLMALVVDATGCTAELAAEVLAAMDADSKVGYTPGLVRHLAAEEPTAFRRRWLDGIEAARAEQQRALPPRCGECDARDGDDAAARMVLDPDTGQPRPCPRCHPSALEVIPDAS